MTDDRKSTGDYGETLARNYLKKNGYNIIESNFRTRFGELDIIARKKECLVFVEVRTKQSHNYGEPEESMTATKCRHLTAAAYQYLRSHNNLPENWRIDFIGISFDVKGDPVINHIESAVGEI
jgi:putative endonuclease